MTIAEQLRQEGMKQGMEQRIRAEKALLTRQLKRRFLSIPAHYLCQIEQAPPDTLLAWMENLLDAQTIESVFHTVH